MLPTVNTQSEELSHIFIFKHKYDDIPIEGSERICIEVQNNKVISYFKNWHKFAPVSYNKQPIAAEEAVEIFARNVDKILPLSGEPIEIEDVKLAYWTDFLDSRDGSAKLRPVWRIAFRLTESNSELSLSYLNIDALSGKVLY